MGSQFEREPMLDLFIVETLQLTEQLEQLILNGEQRSNLESSINEIFRIMHTIKGSAAMMLFNDISKLAHSLEDLFYYLREEKPEQVDLSILSDLVLAGVDFIKNEIEKLQNGTEPDGDSSQMISRNKEYLAGLRDANPSHKTSNAATEKPADPQKFYIGSDQSAPNRDRSSFKVILFFEDGSELEDIRAYTVLHQMREFAENIHTRPEEIINNNDSVEFIKKNGLQILFDTSRSFEEVRDFFNKTVLLKTCEIVPATDSDWKEFRLPEALKESTGQEPAVTEEKPAADKNVSATPVKQKFINVNVDKLDKLMDLVGELVISEAMVTRNPELAGMQLEGFHKSARQLHKITNELQDVVMSVRMIPLTNTFQKMQRIVRDMSRKQRKDVELVLLGEETEVDKNIIEQLSDPLMHMIRNAIDHGIEPVEERKAKGKPEVGRITLEAKNSGSEVWIIVRDDGRGLNKDKILKKALANGLLNKPEAEMTEREIFSLILLPGFSTKEKVTEFSGRGVGMDVVLKNIEKVGGTVLIESEPEKGTAFVLRIPLTLAIIDGMTIRVGNSLFTVPTPSIRESFRAKENQVITDPDGQEMILLRGECNRILRLHELFKIKSGVRNFQEGILIMVENDTKSICLFADELLGEQQVVVKGLPRYIKKVRGLNGCTLLGDGRISLILDIGGLISAS